jgi:imidazolonepropionase-like amidohydrolase
MKIASIRGHVIIGTGETIDDGAVLLEGDTISWVGKSAEVPSADVTIELQGRTLTPGLIDVHIHMIGGNKASGLGGEAATFKMNDSSAKALLEGVAAANIALKAGFTTVHEVGGRDYLDVALHDAQAQGHVIALRILASGPGAFPTGGLGSYLEPNGTVDSVEGAVHRVRAMISRGVDVIKLVSADGPQQLGKHWAVFPTADEVAALFAEATRCGRLKAAHG